MVKHPEYWKDFDPIRINLDRNNDPAVQKFAPGTRKLIKFLELVNQGTPKEDALQLVDNICKSYTRVKKTLPSSAKKEPGLIRGKKLSNEPLKLKVGPKSKTQFKPQIGPKSKVGNRPLIGPKSKVGPKSRIGPKSKVGPKSKMALLASKDGISRDEIEKLERYFLQNTCKPTDFQMHQWASEMSVDFEYISNWFQNKWKGKLEYEANKCKESEIDEMRSRRPQKFDAEVFTDAFAEALNDGEDCQIENNNADDDE